MNEQSLVELNLQEHYYLLLENVRGLPNIFILYKLNGYINIKQAIRNSGMLESRIPARDDICRQCWLYLQTKHVYLQIILSYDPKYLKKWNLAGI